MSYATEAQVVRERLNTNWTTTQIHWPNTDFTPGTSPWIRPTILPADARAADIATAPRYRHVGVLIIQVFVPLGAGDGLALEYADTIAALFRGQNVSGVRFYGEDGEAVRIRNVGPDGKGFFQMNVECPMFRDTIF